MLGEGLALCAPTRKSLHRCCLGRSLFRRQLVLGGVGFQLFERQRQLLDQPRRTLRPLAIDLTLKLGDPKLLLGDQGAIFRRLRTGDREFSGDSKPFARSAASASFKAATSSGAASRSAFMRRSESQIGGVVIPQNAKSRRFLHLASAQRSPA
jgi:hypothetical protein